MLPTGVPLLVLALLTPFAAAQDEARKARSVAGAVVRTASPSPTAGDAGSRPPDVLLVILDDVALSDADTIETPALDWLATRGVEFRRAYAMPYCNPTRYTLLFGEYRGTDNGSVCKGIASANTPFNTRFSLPKMMKARGYKTAAFGKWHLGLNRTGAWELAPNAHGFDTWRAGSPENVVDCNGSDYWDWLRVDDGLRRKTNEYHTTAVLGAFTSWWRSVDGPRFAYVALQAPHTPFHVPPPELTAPGYPVPKSKRAKYEAMVRSTDIALGAMLEHVDLARTIVIVLGDDGTPKTGTRLGQNKRKVKGTTFEDGVRVPFVVAGAGIEASHRTSGMAHVVDVIATLAELVGADYPADVASDSRSLVPLLRSPAAQVRTHVFCDTDPGRPLPGQPSTRDRAVIFPRFKLRVFGKQETLYDLERDPREVDPIDPNRPDMRAIAARLRQALLAEQG